ncbi:MAG: nitroreductase [Chloroflexota bacterium]
MDVIEAIRSRKSIRAYKPDPVPREILREILEVAARAPSSQNTQPWEFTVIAGEVLEKIRQANSELFDSRPPQRGGISRTLTGKYRERQIGLAVQLFQLMGIGREDKQKRTEWMRRGFHYFDAPAVIFISTEKELGESAVFDIGAVAQTIALAAMKHCLGTCIQDRSLIYLDVVKKLAGIPESKRIVVCLSIGYPDWDFPANKVYTAREPVDNITVWRGI